MDFDSLKAAQSGLGTAAVIVMDKSTDVVDALARLSYFYKHESCGQCTPCRAGCGKAVQLMQAEKWDKTLLNDLCDVMQDASICGLGQAAPNPIRLTMKHFSDEIS